MQGFQGDNLSDETTVLACVKHMAAYGAAQAGRDYHSVDMSDRVLREVYLPPYKAAIDAGALSVMTSFNDVHGTPASANKYLMTDILRNEWGFDGFVVTDYTAINELIPHGVAAEEYQAGLLAMKAGVDMDMEGGIYMDHLKAMVENGDVSIADIDQAVRRVLTLKFMLGIMDDPFKYCDEEREQNEIFSKKNRDAAYEMAAKSMVLLKNDNQTLPFQAGDNIVVIGPLANSKRDLIGSWKAAGEHKRATTILEAIKTTNKNGKVTYARGCDVNTEDQSGFDAAIAAARKADKVILVMGEKWSMTGEAACRTDIGMPGVQTELIREIKKLNKPVVLVLMTGRAMALEQEDSMVDALLNIWYPGLEGGKATADALFGKFSPSGKLTMTFPRNVGQVPIYYNHKHAGRPYDASKPEDKYKSRYLDSPNTPLYPFGHGLSYTTFDYSPITLSSTSMDGNGSIVASVEVTNTGAFDAEEVVQLYIQDQVASVTRPVKELKGFEKSNIKMGESKTITFTVTEKELSFYRQDMSFGAEKGAFTLFIGPNSDTQNTIEFELTSVSF
ncbi:MAG: glycoside hydrolase family 3 C-terminal domain-containing protein [Marinilabiliaceae bacterium]|nr:glycoside hydrolase family 3 C-terminal domain-containing protein [Marinilabiliaceae bacterium]